MRRRQHTLVLGETRRAAQRSRRARVASADGYFLRINPAFTDILGWDEDELLQRPYAELVHPDDREATEAETAKLAQGGTTAAFENRFRTRDGRYVWFLWKATSVPEPFTPAALQRKVAEILAHGGEEPTGGAPADED